jgi:hypothetical protein
MMGGWMFEKRSGVYRERRNGTVFGYSYRSWRLDYTLHVRDVLCKYAIHSKVSRIVFDPPWYILVQDITSFSVWLLGQACVLSL